RSAGSAGRSASPGAAAPASRSGRPTCRATCGWGPAARRPRCPSRAPLTHASAGTSAPAPPSPWSSRPTHAPPRGGASPRTALVAAGPVVLGQVGAVGHLAVPGERVVVPEQIREPGRMVCEQEAPAAEREPGALREIPPDIVAAVAAEDHARAAADLAVVLRE